MTPRSKPSLYVLSFCDGDLPKGSQFLGGCFVMATGLIDAVTQSHHRGCNPGGEVKIINLGIVPETAWLDKYAYRIMDRKETEECEDPRKFGRQK